MSTRDRSRVAPNAATLMTDRPESAALGELDRAALVEAWQATHGRPPPRGLGKRLLALGAAYHRQVELEGGLKPNIRKRLERIADGKPDRPIREARHSSRKAPVAGTRLLREWQGESHVVEVLENGVLYRGEAYRSLSEVARSITGARWSGPRFFGL